MATATWSALGTDVVVSVEQDRDLEPAEQLARTTLGHVDQTCSRFRDDSDLSRVNRSPGVWVGVDPLLVAAVATALEVAARTDGLVHPLLGRDLVVLGYDRDLAAVRALPDVPLTVLDEPRPDGLLDAWRDVEVEPGRLRIPVGTALDLGATGKAWAADLVVRAWSNRLHGHAAVSVGGDAAVTVGAPPWPVDVRVAGDEPVRVLLHGGGVATSSTRLRRWRRAGHEHHHLLDPRTGRPVREVWTTVTATGPTCVAANASSTCSMVLGEAAPGWLAARDIAARLVDTTGQVVTVGRWPRESRRSA